ncbi:Citrate synthase, mitochondrial, partial [Myotis brandtii]
NASCLVPAAEHASASSAHLKVVLADLIPKEQAELRNTVHTLEQGVQSELWPPTSAAILTVFAHCCQQGGSAVLPTHSPPHSKHVKLKG